MTASQRMSAAEFRALSSQPRNPRNKFSATRVVSDVGVFDSAGEHQHYRELALLERAGKVRDVKRQQKFPLVSNGAPVMLTSKTGRKTQSVYIADFTYCKVPENTFVICDFKGIDTKLSQLKRAILQTMLPDAELLVVYAKSKSSRRPSYPRKKRK